MSETFKSTMLHSVKLDDDLLSGLDGDSVALPVQLLDRANIVLGADINGRPFKSIAEFAKFSFPDGIKGVNQKLKPPTLVTKHNLGEDVRSISLSGKDMIIVLKNLITFDVVANPDLELVAFNKKNLMKYCGYSEFDAKNFFLAMRARGRFDMIKPTKEQKLNVFCVATSESQKQYGKTVAYWADINTLAFGSGYTEHDINVSRREANLADEDLIQSPLKVVELPLELWRETTKSWLTEDKGYDPELISRSDMNRHVVNMIRHCADGYHRWWKLATAKNAQSYHDEAYEILMKQIWAKYPTLQNEVKRQLQLK